jgi:hypothetical protein
MSNKMRIIHRYLGFFLAGIMAVYALSGIVLIFRDSDTFKRPVTTEFQTSKNIPAEGLAKALERRRLEITKTDGKKICFENGFYNQDTGKGSITEMELPYFLDKMTHLHKAKSSQPLFFLNIIFGLGLLTFVITAFWMFIPSSKIFKKGIFFSLAGLTLAMILLFV